MSDVISLSTIRERVIELIAAQTKLDPAQIHTDSTLKDLGLASLNAIELIFDVEEAFDITFPDQGPNLDTDTVQGLVNAVVAANEERSARSAGKA